MAFIPIENLGGGVAQAKNVYLYKDGVQKVTLGKSGYVNADGATLYDATYGTSTITIPGLSNGIRLVGTLDSVDLTNYATVHAKVKISQYQNGYGPKFAIFKDKNGFGPNSTKIAEINTTSTLGTDWVDLSLDISAWSGIGYVTISAWYTLTNVEVSEIYLEPYPTRLSDGELYSYGVDGKLWDNTGYAYDSRFTVDGGFTFNKRNISCNMPTSDFHDRCIVTKDTVNLSSYSYVKIKYNDTQIASINVSSITTSAYIVLETHCANGSYQFVAYIAQSKNNYTSNFLGSANIVSKSSAHTPTVSRIWLE